MFRSDSLLDVTVSQVSAPGPLPDGVSGVGPPWELSSVALLVGPVRVAIPAPDGGDDTLLATWNGAAWEPVGAVWDPATSTVTATVTHFSIWWPVRWPGWELFSKARKGVESVFGVGDLTGPPRCNKALPLTVTPAVPGTGSDAFRLDGCAEPLGGGRYRVKLANRRPLSIRFHVEDIVDASDPKWEWPSAGQIAASSLDKLNTALGVHGFGGTLIEGGATYEFTTSGAFSVGAEIDNQSVVWSVLLAAAGELEGGWAVLSAFAEQNDVFADLDGLDWPALTSRSLEKVAGLVEALAKASNRSTYERVAGTTSAFLSMGGVTFRAIGETLDFRNANATVSFDPSRLPATDEDTLRSLAMARCTSPFPAEPCKWNGTKVSRHDPRYVLGSAVAEGHAGTVFRRNGDGFEPVRDVGGGADGCEGWGDAAGGAHDLGVCISSATIASIDDAERIASRVVSALRSGDSATLARWLTDDDFTALRTPGLTPAEVVCDELPDEYVCVVASTADERTVAVLDFTRNYQTDFLVGLKVGPPD